VKDFLAKRWFLLLLVCGIGLAGWRSQDLQPAAQVLKLQFLVAAALFVIAWGLESRSLVGSLLRPWPALWAVLISYGFVPACGWLTGQLLPDDFRIGLMICTSCPCTLAAAVLWTRMAGGSEGTALLVILLTTCTSWLVTTTWLVVGTGESVQLDTAGMMRDLALILIVPVALGQLSRAVGPLQRIATRHKRVLGVVSQLMIFTVIFKTAVDVSASLRERPPDVEAWSLAAAAVLCLGTHLAALATGLWSGKALGFDRPSRIAIAFAGSQKTLPVALLIFATHFRQSYPLAVLPLLFYHVGQLVVDTFIADGLVSRQRSEAIPAGVVSAPLRPNWEPEHEPR
jgi:sodium/bile acid cotransporter 7